ncbi:MAG: valine--tRNA ligase [Clostridiales bacterium]|jgi:valyl-tRNA synthetase|nr:valine--tRNA ligase [Clostridiales bacterium]
MEKNYGPSGFEGKIYAEWLDKKYFRAAPNPDKKPFAIMMPPPNVTGQLHMGHALNNALQDCIVRYKRMRGFEALWMPGTDHASIATEVKVAEKMRADEGLTKADVGREGFLERAWAWTAQYGGRIVEQLKRLGCSCDWDRLAFTMDAPRAKAVTDVFVRLYRDGRLYKGDRIVNWCVACKTAISDAEVEYETRQSSLWHIKYPVKNDGRGQGAEKAEYITVATTRPETMLGDTAVAVSPDDKRYRDLIGKTLILPLANREIPIVADAYVDKAFGTGAVKVTPAHDPNDFEMGARHNLPVIRVMNDDGTMNERAGAFAGLTREAAREAVVAALKERGFLVKIQKHTHNAGHCYRCGSVIEPIVSRQWFVRMKELAAPAVKAVEDKTVKLTPKRFEKIYLHWMRNVKDWCVSRQLWWGHRIPAYTCGECGELIVDYAKPDTCPKCGGAAIEQDPDVLDTWFSSALWPFSTLGFPDKTPELAYFYPTDVLVTAYDIIFFWVARMVFSGLYNMGEVPFKRVAFTGLVRDVQGRKMSKSLGNGIDPLELIDKYGADSLRFSLLNGTAAGGDMRFGPERVVSARNFMNKIWNAARFFHNAQCTMHNSQLSVGERSDNAECNGHFSLSEPVTDCPSKERGHFSLSQPVIDCPSKENSPAKKEKSVGEQSAGKACRADKDNAECRMQNAECNGHFSLSQPVIDCPSKENSPAKKEKSVGEVLSGSNSQMPNEKDPDNAFQFSIFNFQLSDKECRSEQNETYKLSPADKWILTRLNDTVKRASAFLDNYDAGLACAVIYDFIWGELCDWYIELVKPALYSDDAGEKGGALAVLARVLKSALKLLHPIAPFVTEEIWRSLPKAPGDPESVMTAAYPEYDKKLVFRGDAERFDKVRELIRGVRNLRAELNVPQNKRPRLFIFCKKEEKLVRRCLPYIRTLTFSGEADFIADAAGPQGRRTSVCVSDLADAYIYTDELIDLEKESARLQKEIENAEREIKRCEGKLADKGFIANAPKAVAAAEKEKSERYRVRLAELRASLARLGLRE